MRKGLLAIVCTAMVNWNAFAQDQIDRAKYELIRETINFLATDKAVSQDTNFRITCETLDEGCFKQQLSRKTIAGIDRWYNSWQSTTVTDEAGLIALRNQLFADILERPGKGYRKQHPGYEGYIANMEDIINQYAQYGEEIPMSVMDVDTASTPLLSPPESYPSNLDPLVDQDENSKTEDTMIAYLALAIGILAIVIAVRPLFKKQEQHSPLDTQILRNQLDELTWQVKRLEDKVTDTQEQDEAITNLTDIMESVEKRVVELENGSKPRVD